MGFDREVVENLPTIKYIILNNERLTRYSDIDQSPFDNAPKMQQQEIEIYECYVKIDMDGDGVAELRKVIVAGESGYEILENMPCDNIPFCH